MDTREMLTNNLIHREFSSPYIAKFVIEQDKMYVENANRAVSERIITPENLEPNPKNPIIAAFFRNIGYSDQLGSGVRNLFKYTKLYSDQEPIFKESDIFRITIPLDDDFSYDFGNINHTSADKMPINADKVPISGGKNYTKQQLEILRYVAENGKITTKETESLLQIKQRRAREILSELVKNGALKKEGSYKSTVYIAQDLIPQKIF